MPLSPRPPRSPARPSTRREFLTNTSLAVAGTVLGARRLKAGLPVRIPADSPQAADVFLEGIAGGIDMKALAQRAIDTAKQGGADYADIRVSERHTLRLFPPAINNVALQTEFTFGIRALVDGVWGFSYGRAPDGDNIAQYTRDAVSAARLAAKLGAAAPVRDWAPPPPATGEWTVPIEIDPFTVPIQQQAELINAVDTTVQRIPGSMGSFETEWVRETRVCASTTGTLISQQLYRAYPRYQAAARYGLNYMPLRVPGFHWKSAGYELYAMPGLMDKFKEATEEATWFARLPMRALDVGRYPVALDGAIMGSVLITLLSQSLELDRVMGMEVDASGTSRMTPDLLGTTIMSPLVTVNAHRNAPSVTAVKWDDEGGLAQEHTVIRNGVLVDYHTSSETLPALKSWYQKENVPLRSNGCAGAIEARKPVSIHPPQLVMTPSKSKASLEELYKDMKKGIVVMREAWITTDQQLASGAIGWGQMYEVSQGKIVRRLKDMQLQFNTLPFLKGITAIGDATTVQDQDVSTSKGLPWVSTPAGATAPAALFKEVNAVSIQMT